MKCGHAHVEQFWIADLQSRLLRGNSLPRRIVGNFVEVHVDFGSYFHKDTAVCILIPFGG